jgi:hypothetical protein
VAGFRLKCSLLTENRKKIFQQEIAGSKENFHPSRILRGTPTYLFFEVGNVAEDYRLKELMAHGW